MKMTICLTLICPSFPFKIVNYKEDEEEAMEGCAYLTSTPSSTSFSTSSFSSSTSSFTSSSSSFFSSSSSAPPLGPGDVKTSPEPTPAAGDDDGDGGYAQ